jgi:hypothetical protein
MKSLREYKISLGGGGGNESEGITWGTAFTPPIHATVNGLPVRVLSIGDLPGASPVYQCVDAQGFSIAVKQSDVVIIDGAYLPLQNDLLTARDPSLR